MGRDTADANLLKRFRGSPAARAAQAVCQYWTRTLGAVQVETALTRPSTSSPAWASYTRPWRAASGRGAEFYQSGGAFGFRDQLQDAVALVRDAEPRLLRRHLLRCATPSVPRGRRPALVASALGPGRAHALFGRLSLAAVGNVPLCREHRRRSVLEESISFLDGRLVAEEDSYDLPPVRGREEACTNTARAILHGCARDTRPAAHGSGDWNDGMNKVGEHGTEAKASG